MKSRFLTALTLSAALVVATATPSFAQYRTAEPQSFTAEELQAYGLDAQASQRAIALQNEGYEIRVLSEEEAQAYQAGITDNQWLLLGILAGVIVIAVAVAD
ncbi:MAG TPA: hypothetical protein PLS69_02985 [Terricaulis sp.]|nr:hypothetical protein [Terricaulis sp.]HRP10961.1 hypothetical protein [Terricaulis sp.]